MATGGINDFFNDITDCPVCFDKYNDPRILECGHHFCAPCLKNIASQDVSPLNVKCPTCRHVTTSLVDHIPEYKGLLKDITADIINRTNNANASVSKPCVYCSTPESATLSCIDCRIVFCEKCRPSHRFFEDLEKHVPRRLTKNQFCSEHNAFIQWICVECNVGLCSVCAPKHYKHKVQDAASLAKELRKRLQREILDVYIKEKKGEKLLINQMSNVGRSIDESWKFRKHLLECCEAKVLAIQKEIVRMNGLAPVLHGIDETLFKQVFQEIQDSHQCKEKIALCTKNLINIASDVDVCLESNYCWNYKAVQTSVSICNQQSVMIPSSVKLQNIDFLLNCITPLLTQESTEVPFSIKPLGKLVVSFQTYCCKKNVPDFVYHPGLNELVFRNGKNIEDLNFSRQSLYYKCSTLGLFIANSAETGCLLGAAAGIALDSKLDAFLLPKWGSHLDVCTAQPPLIERGILMSPIFHRVFPDLEQKLYGISVTPEGLYAVSSDEPKDVFLYDPDSRILVHSFRPSTAFKTPQQVASGPFYHEKNVVSVIAVTDTDDHCVKILDMTGKLLHTFGTPGERGNDDNRMNSPRKVCVDANGDVIVCDMGNQQIVAFSLEDGETKRKVLYKFDDLGERHTKYKRSEGSSTFHKTDDPIRGPKCLSYDSKNRRLFVVDNHPDGDRLTVLQEK